MEEGGARMGELSSMVMEASILLTLSSNALPRFPPRAGERGPTDLPPVREGVGCVDMGDVLLTG
jgi:hypothetical protein